MIIMRIRSIFLLLLINISLYGEPIDVTFEILNTPPDYLNIVQKKAYEMKKVGFRCYILKNKTRLSLRCNDAHSTKKFQQTIKQLNDNNISFTVINKDIKSKPVKYKSLNEFYLGYAAFNRKEYQKALRIFAYNYKKDPNFEHSYAYSLALLKTKQYEKALYVLKKHLKNKKARKLYKDIALTYFYSLLNHKDYVGAKEVVQKYMPNKAKYQQIVYKQEINDLVKLKKYDEAKELARKYNIPDVDFTIDYLIALDMNKEKKYQQANIILSKYFDSHTKARDLLLSNVMAIASEYYTNKEYDTALEKLQGYRQYSPKIKALYKDILYNKYLDRGWSLVEKDPQRALNSFKKACQLKPDFDCYKGLMYSYFNLKNYKKSLYLANKLYRYKPTDDVAVIAMQNSLKMKDFESAKYWFSKVKDKKGLPNPYLLETFLSIDRYIKVKDFDEAQRMIDYLVSLYPQNIKVLEKQLEVYLVTNEYQKAKETALKILEIDSNSLAANYALSYDDYQHKNYISCVERLSDYNLTENYQKKLFNTCNAYVYAQRKNINRAIDYIERNEDNASKSKFYLDIGDMYAKKGYPEAARAYKKAYDYDKGNFGLLMLYLYALKDTYKDDVIEKELAVAYKRYPEKHEELNKFVNLYQKDRLFSYYKNRQYFSCAKYAKLLEKQTQDREIYRMGGWCSYYLKEYENAKRTFAQINHSFGETTEDIYAFALSAHQNGDDEQAIEALDRIRLIDNEKDALLVARLYMDLDKQKKARKILLKLPESDKRDAILVAINKSYMRKQYENSASVGMYYESRSGVDGKSRLDKYIVPLDYDYYNKEDKYHIYFDGDILYLYNGYLTDNSGTNIDFGLNSTTQVDDLTSDIGFMPTVGIDTKYIQASIGLTPVGAKIAPELRWSLSAKYLYNKLLFRVAYKQQHIEETMLSFVGERAVDKSLEVNWGRVLKRGFEGGISYDKNVILSLNFAYYPEIFGLNVINNSEFKTTATAVYHPNIAPVSYMDVGVLVAYDSYEKNSNLFTYGHGGYFSPQDFWLGSVFTQFGDIVNDRFYYQAKLSLGFEGFLVDDAQKFPLSNDPALIGIQQGYSDGGITYKGGIEFGYNFTKNLDMIAGVSMEKMYAYEVKQVSFSLVYRFDDDKRKKFNTFRLNHRVENIMK
jgi:tetratricopeptide (TPR) repeat protein